MQKNQVPCEECLVLPICLNKTVINCYILMKAVNKKYLRSKYPDWPNFQLELDRVLNGAWCTVGINNKIRFIQKDRHDGDNNFVYRK